MTPFDIIGFDADDTLWQTEHLYVEAQGRLREMLGRYVADENMDGKLYETEMRNLEHFGYGIKAFALSMIETAIELTDGRVSARDIQSIVEMARDMIAAEIDFIEGAPEAVAALAASHTLMLITKGDLRDQETKIERSGLAAHFRYIEIVSSKSPGMYRTILQKYNVPPSRFLMIGNALRSDILPVLEIGGSAVYIPWKLTWAHDDADTPPAAQRGFHQLEHIGQLPELISQLENPRSPEP